MIDMVENIVIESWQVLGQMAPYLLFGFLIAGVLSVCVSPEWVERHLGGGGAGPVLKASLFGVPLPLCSCGVIPVSASFHRHGASRAATTSFLLSTPQTGVDSILVTYSLLGPVFAVFRPLAALLTGFIGGGLVQFFDKPSQSDVANKTAPAVCHEACCAGKGERSALSRILSYGFITLPRDIGAALLIGILIAGLISAIVPPDYLTAYIGGGILSILLMMAAGVPVYVCATASVPIAAGFMYMGASPGAALAFLIAGPATNAATFTTIVKVLGRRTAILYLVTVAFSAFTWGLILDWLAPFAETFLPQLGSHTHVHLENSLLSHIWAITLLAVLVFSYISMSFMKKEKTMEEGKDKDTSSHKHRLELQVTGMTCSHCVESVRRALAESPGVHSVDVDLKSARVVVTGENFDGGQLAAAVSELGYTARVVSE